MKFLSFSTSRQTTVALSTIFVVGLLFAYYFLVHTKVQENRLKKQAFNQLITLSKGFKENLESHKIAIEKLLEGSRALIFNTYYTLSDSMYNKELNDFNHNLDILLQTYSDNPTTENLQKYYDYEYSFSEFEIEQKTLEKLQDTIPKSAAFKLVNIKKESITNSDEDNYIEDYKPSVMVNITIEGDSIIFTSIISGKVKDDYLKFTLLFYTDLNKFISQTFNNRIFDDFILISDENIMYQTLDYKFETIDYDTLRKLNREVNYIRNIVENFKKNGSSGDVVTDESLVGKAVSAKNFYDINISETEYKLFLNQFIVEGKFWVLCGFINSSEFNQQKRAVEPSFLLIIITVLFIILLASQLIKLFVSSQVEQYYIHNMIFSVISITAGSSILVISLLSGISYWVEDRQVKDQDLKNLNEDISRAFSNELSEVIHYLKSGDKVLADSGWYSPPMKISRGEFEKKIHPLGEYDGAFDNTFWINAKGEEILRVYEKTKPLSLMNVSQRAYFSELQEGNGYNFEYKKGESAIKFYFQPLKSWVTGKKIVVTSINSIGDTIKKPNNSTPVVAAMATQFRSLQNCILPNGFGFLLIDETGKVLFHDDERLSLSENFLQECSEVDEVKSAILSRTASRNSINYHNKKYRIYLKAIPQMPLFLITYHDREYFRLPGVLIFYYTILFSLIGLLAVAFWVIFLFIFNYRGSKLKYKSLILNWAFPNNKKNKWYWKATMVNLIATLIISLSVLFFSETLTHSFLMIFLACNFIFPINYFLLEKCPRLEDKKMNLEDIYQLIFKGHVTVVFILLLSVFNLIIMVSGYNYWLNLLIYQAALLTLLFFPFYLDKYEVLSWIYGKLEDFSLSHSYTSFTVSWIVLVSIIPTIFYYNIVRTNEKNIWLKYDQLLMIRNLHERELQNMENGKFDNKKVDKGIYLVYDKHSFAQDTSSNMWKYESGLINAIFYNLRLPIVELSSLSKSLVSDIQTGQRDWSWQIEDKNNDNTITINYTYLGDSNTVLAQKPQNLSDDQVAESKSPSRRAIITIKIIINTSFIILMVMLIYFMLYYLLKKIFGFEFLISKTLIASTDEQIQKSVQNRGDIFVIGLPSPSFEDLKDSIDEIEHAKQPKTEGSDKTPLKFKTHRIDLQHREDIDLEEIYLVDKEIIILDHFEYACNELSKLRNNLILIERLKKEGKQIVIFSHVSPRQIERIYKNQRALHSSINKEEVSKYIPDEDLWSKLMTSFQVLHYRLKMYDVEEEYVSSTDESKLQNQLSKLIKKELSASTYFKNVEHLVHQKYEEIIQKHGTQNVSQGFIETVKEEMILYIQDIAQTYYFSLWKTCYKNQRFLLYDLAYDGIANFKDGGTVLFLMKKGLLKFDNGIEIMNKSFRNFIIDAIGEEDALAMRKEMEQKGTWSSTRIVLVIVAISLLIFILMVNKGSINQVSAIITGSVALIGVLLRIFSFGSGSSFISDD